MRERFWLYPYQRKSLVARQPIAAAYPNIENRFDALAALRNLKLPGR